jgi:hypothetical protein
MFQYTLALFVALLPHLVGAPMLTTVSTVDTPRDRSQPDRKSEMGALLADAPTSAKAAEHVNKAIPEAKTRAGNRLEHSDRSLTLFTVWQDLKNRRSSSATTDEVARFVGRCESILGIEAPQTWIDSLYNGNKEWKSFTRLASVEYLDIGGGLRARQSSITYRDNRLHLQLKQNKSLVIPLTTLKPPPCESIDFIGLDDNGVLVAFPSKGSSSYKLMRYDGNKDRIVWCAEVWSSDLAASSGRNHHYVDLVIAEREVVVFGSDAYSAYIESFSLDSGTPRIRFNTRRWSR